MRRFKILILLFVVALSGYSEKVHNVSSKYTYNAPENISLETAKRVAIERAKIQALADEFGTVVSQSNSTVISNENGDSNTRFFSLGRSEVRGEWIADTKEPEIEVMYIDNSLLITVEVRGKAREVRRAEYDLSIHTLCNGFESEKFNNNDRLSVRLRTPLEGFLSIWLADDNVQTVYCLLPYDNSSGNAREVKSRSDNIFLSTADPLYPYREETIMVTDKEQEFNRLIFIFSPDKFTMPLTEHGEYLPELNTKKFEQWLQKNRVRDGKMYVEQRIIEINNK